MNKNLLKGACLTATALLAFAAASYSQEKKERLRAQDRAFFRPEMDSDHQGLRPCTGFRRPECRRSAVCSAPRCVDEPRDLGDIYNRRRKRDRAWRELSLGMGEMLRRKQVANDERR